MDALELDDDVSDKNQAGGELLTRELGKCFTGFSGVKDKILATGAWGCGAFGGDKEIKFRMVKFVNELNYLHAFLLAIQLATASEAGVKMFRLVAVL